MQTQFYLETSEHVKINSTRLESILPHPKLKPNMHFNNYNNYELCLTITKKDTGYD